MYVKNGNKWVLLLIEHSNHKDNKILEVSIWPVQAIQRNNNQLQEEGLCGKVVVKGEKHLPNWVQKIIKDFNEINNFSN